MHQIHSKQQQTAHFGAVQGTGTHCHAPRLPAPHHRRSHVRICTRCMPPEQPASEDGPEGKHSTSTQPDTLQQPVSLPQQQQEQQHTQQQQQSDEYETVYETEEVVAPPPAERRFSIPGRQVHLTSSAAPFASATGLPPSAESSVFGWVMSAAILAAIRLSRETADAERMDLRVLQARQAESRVQDAELRARRAAYLEAERQRREADAARSMALARQQAEQEAAQRAQEEAVQAQKQKHEAELLRIRQEEARKEFFKADSMLAEELERRTQLERKLMEESEAKRKAEEEAQRREEAERAAAEAAAAAARAEAERAAAEAAQAAQAEERRRIQSLFTRYTLVLQGAVVAQAAPLNTFTTASTSAVTGVPPLPQPARLQVSMKLGLQAAFQQQPPASSSGQQRQRAQQAQPSCQQGGQQQQQQQQQQQGQQGGNNTSRAEAPSSDNQVHLPASSSPPSSSLQGSVGSSDALPLRVLPREEVLAFASVDAALDGSVDLAGLVAGQLLDDVWAQLVQDVGAEGRPAILMDEIEMEHWKRLCIAAAEASCRRGVSRVAPIASGSEPLDSQLQVTCHRAALPRGHPARINSRLSAAVAFTLDGQLQEAVEIVNKIIQEELEMADTKSQLPGVAPNVPLPTCTVHALTYAHLIDRAASTISPTASSSSSSSSSSSEAFGASSSILNGDSSSSSTGDSISGGGAQGSEGGSKNADIDEEYHRNARGDELSTPSISPEDEAKVAQLQQQQQQLQPLLNLARYQLQLAAKAAKPDELIPTARSVALALGSDSHPVAAIMAQLAEQNMSAYARQRLERRRQQQELETAAALLKRHEPQGVDPSSDPSRRLTPVPEQLWGLRNLANKMIFYDNSIEILDALGWLRDACEIAAQYYGPGHPSQLGPLLDYQAALQVAINAAGESDRQEEMQQLLATRLVVSNKIVELVQLVGDRYLQQKDFLSAVLLYEATLRGLGRLLPEDHPGMAEIQRLTRELLLSAISPAEARIVSRKRSEPKSALQVLAQGFTADLGVFALRKPGTSFPEQWKKGLPLPPLR